MQQTDSNNHKTSHKICVLSQYCSECVLYVEYDHTDHMDTYEKFRKVSGLNMNSIPPHSNVERLVGFQIQN